MEAAILIAMCLSIFVLVSMLLRRGQRHIWNGGYCGCGGMWRYFDMDSGGAHGAKCDRCSCVYWFDWYVGKEIDPLGLLQKNAGVAQLGRGARFRSGRL